MNLRDAQTVTDREYLARVGQMISRSDRIPGHRLAHSANAKGVIAQPTYKKVEEKFASKYTYLSLIGACIAVKMPLHLMQLMDEMLKENVEQFLEPFGLTRKNMSNPDSWNLGSGIEEGLLYFNAETNVLLDFIRSVIIVAEKKDFYPETKETIDEQNAELF